jgi:predicted nucleic acid-binding protein
MTSIALDSNCFTYLIDDLCEKPPTQDKLGPEKTALVKLFFYRPNDIEFYLSPTVINEYKKIKNYNKLENHHSWCNIHFLEMASFLNDNGSIIQAIESEVEMKAKELHTKTFPNKKNNQHLNDCKIVVECDKYNIDTLLSYDTDDMLKKINDNSEVNIQKPSKFLSNFDLKKAI